MPVTSWLFERKLTLYFYIPDKWVKNYKHTGNTIKNYEHEHFARRPLNVIYNIKPYFSDEGKQQKSKK